MPSPEPRAAIDAEYRARVEQAKTNATRLQRADRSWSTARGVCGLLLIAAGIGWYAGAITGWMPLLLIPLIIWLARRHEALLEQLTEAQHVQRLYEQQLARRERRWADIPVPQLEPRATPAVARDLDLFGPRSLFHWMCLAQTPLGREALRDWLLPAEDPCAAPEAFAEQIASRQRVVQLLAGEQLWREQLWLHASRLGDAATSGRAFLEWAKGPTWLHQHPGLLALVRLVPVLMLVIVSLGITGFLPWFTVACLVVPVFIMSFATCFLYSGTVHDIFDRVSRRGDEMAHYGAILQVATQVPAVVGSIPLPTATAATTGPAELRDVAQAGLLKLDTLQQLMMLANLRRAGLLSIVAIVLNWLLLWEFHLLALVERWQQHHGGRVQDWLTAIGTLEALSSLATVAHDEPDWCYPEFAAAEKRLVATALGHPLLPEQGRVTNDVELGPPGSFLLVTGSNMSGKSTLLRAIGVNVLLAQAGAPVCARHLRLPQVQVKTSMRVADSLADGQSFFFAELLRLKEVVDGARRARQSGTMVLYLLDEILQGTNSAERRVAVVEILRHLLEQPAIGAISTHDLELAGCPELTDHCQLAHFRETLSDPANPQTMTFDYRIHPGLCPTTNALILLELVGLRQ